jgi:hypothetical protein
VETGNPEEPGTPREESRRLISEMEALLERAKKIVKRYEEATDAALASKNEPGNSGRAD